MSSRTLAFVVLGLALCSIGSSRCSDFYTWTDENGVMHVADSLEEVPAKYRGAVKAPDSTPAPKPVGAKAKIETAAPAATTAAGDSISPRKLEVPYQAFEGTARRVILPVTLNGSVTAKMALDTGAPGMVISVDLAQRLGLFSRDSGTLLVGASGIGGSELGILTIVDSVAVQQARSSFVPTTVTGKSLSAEFDGLVGMDFLANYTIHIDTKKQVVVFEENPCGPECRGGHDQAWWRTTFGEFRQARDSWRERAKAAAGSSRGDVKNLVDFQARESERLLQRLDLYASDNAVPQHWR